MSCCGDGNLIPLFPQTGIGSGNQKPVILIEGPGININDLSDADTYRFFIETVVFVGLTVALTAVAKVGGVIKSLPVLKGTVIDRIELTWVYNKGVATQNLTNDASLTPPVLDPDNFLTNYISQNITSDVTFTITGNDGAGQPNSIATDSKKIAFGNWMYLGAGVSRMNTTTSTVEAFIETLSTVMRTDRLHTYFATGTVDQKHFVAYDAAWGLADFTKGVYTGGYVRLKNVDGTLKQTLGVGEVETPIIMTNEAGYVREVYIYESLYDNLADAVTPFVIS